MPWTNPDGLIVYFPSDGALRNVPGGEFPGAGANRTIEVEFNASALAVAGTPTVIGKPFIIIPRNSVIESVELLSETAFTGGTSLDVGLQNFDGTEYDYDGLFNDILLANLNVVGEKNVVTAGVALAGAAVGAETSVATYLTVTQTGTFVLGRGILRVNLYVKDVDQYTSINGF